MFINGKKLLEAAPIKNMIGCKMKFKGTSWGLSEAGYDIQIKQDVIFRPNKYSGYVSPKENTIITNRFTLASAIEEFEMPLNLVGTVKDKSTWARKGLSVFNTVIEPGWNGFLTLELVYHGSDILKIEAGQGIAQVLFGLLAEDGDYGNGKYQSQENHPVKPRS